MPWPSKTQVDFCEPVQIDTPAHGTAQLSVFRFRIPSRQIYNNSTCLSCITDNTASLFQCQSPNGWAREEEFLRLLLIPEKIPVQRNHPCWTEVIATMASYRDAERQKEVGYVISIFSI